MRLFFIFLLSSLSLFAKGVKFELLPVAEQIEAGGSFELVAEFEIPQGEYIYANEGSDIGLPTEVELKLPEGFTADKFAYPKPEEKLEDGQKILFYPKSFKISARVKAPRNLPKASAQIEANASWLVCGELCIPGGATSKISLNISKPEEPSDKGEADANRENVAPTIEIPKTSNGSENVALSSETPKSSGDFENVAPPSAPADSSPIWLAVFGAFLGGMILNLMPCVFPVISLKILSFAKDADKSRIIALKNALYYSLGIVLSFVFLALLLIWLKSLGHELGWGFQLQEPMFVGFLSLLFTVMALSLAGVFEFGAQLGKLGELSSKSSGAKAALLSGILAVAVASPCTAPFMGSALGVALASSISWFSTLLIFVFLGLGMAFPYVLISAIPQIAKLLPKPGMWMETFKQILAFPLFATAIWLVWIFTKQCGADSMAELLLALLSVSFALWIFGKYSPPYNKLKFRIFAYASLALFLILSIYLVIDASKNPSASLEEEDLSGNSWSEQKVEALRKRGKIVFVDFTASWCFTCLANKKTALDLPSTRELFEKNNVILLVADWTNRNAKIARALAKFGRSGVPLNVVYPADLSRKPIVLPTILTPQAIDEAIDKAR